MRLLIIQELTYVHWDRKQIRQKKIKKPARYPQLWAPDQDMHIHIPSLLLDEKFVAFFLFLTLFFFFFLEPAEITGRYI